MTKRSSKYNRAMDQMRGPDARMVLINYHGKPDYWITPGGYRIDAEVAQKIIAHPLVRGGKDSLFPNMDQTWRLGRGAA
jgi:hypothetical protein